MNKLLKSTLIAGGVMGAFFASNANAQSFNVLIDEIELVSDADNYISSAATVYKPSVGVGAATTTTVDFFADDNERYNLVKPSTGVYESMIVHFTTAEVSGSTAGITNVDLTDVPGNGGFRGALFHQYGGRDVMIFGSIGDGLGASIQDVIAGAVAIPMQPVVVTASGFSVPEFNWNFPAASVEEIGTDVNLVSSLKPFTLANNVDSSDVIDFEFTVKANAFAAATDFNAGTSNIAVGLFAKSMTDARPMFHQTFRPSAADVADGSASETITFYDVPAVDTVPVAWFDADNDKELDQGEYVSMADFTVENSDVLGTAIDAAQTADSTVAFDYNSAISAVTQTAVPFGYRTFDLVIPMGDLDGATAALAPADATFNASGIMVTDAGAGPLATSTWASTSGTALLQVAYDIFDDGTTQVARNFDLAIGYGEETGNSDATIDSGEAMFVVMANAAADNVSGVSFVSSTELLTISGIPFTAITAVSADNTGEYSVTVNSTDDTTPTTTATGLTIEEVGSLTVGAELEAPVAGSITVVVGDGDASNTDGIIDIIDLGTL
ncbi:MAG: hypothetical protein VX730_01120 [Pseudomonadota bacterium]|nr:hypothetical protein [Pseudomonadota bacterium]